jgi:hypothetical protein
VATIAIGEGFEQQFVLAKNLVVCPGTGLEAEREQATDAAWIRFEHDASA